MTRAKHPSKTIMTTSQPFELLHMDLFGPTHYSPLTTTACLYGFVIVDDYSRYTWVHIILYKSEVQDVFRRFANRAMNNYGAKIKHIRSDNGTEFKNTGLDTYLDSLGITDEFSAPYTPQQNGVVERKNRTLIMACSVNGFRPEFSWSLVFIKHRPSHRNEGSALALHDAILLRCVRSRKLMSDA